MPDTAHNPHPQSPHADDAALVRACLAGQPGSWETLVRAYAPLVYTIARRAGLAPDDAEDVSQTVFTSLLTSLATLRDGQSVSKWLIVVAKRHAWKVRQARQLSSAAATDDLPDQHTDSGFDSDSDDAWRRRHAMRQGLAALGGRCQELLTALFIDRHQADYAQISQRLSIPIGSIGPTRNRCLRKLMEILMAAPGAAVLWDAPPPDASAIDTAPPNRPS